MGAFWQRVFTCFIIPLLVVICESFPYVKQGSFDIFNVQNRNTGFDDDAGKIRAEINWILEKDHEMHDLDFLKNKANMLNRDLYSAEHSKNHNVVRRRTENAISNLINTYLRNKTEAQSGHLTPTGIPVGKNSNIRNYKKDIFRHIISDSLSNANHRASKVRKNLFPSNSKRNINTSGLRRRRSFDWDDIFSEDEGEKVIFGAHTTPCDNADRHYCMNGGTCLYVPALQLKTCR